MSQTPLLLRLWELRPVEHPQKGPLDSLLHIRSDWTRLDISYSYRATEKYYKQDAHIQPQASSQEFVGRFQKGLPGRARALLVE